MRKLLNTLYVNNPECFLTLENENVCVLKDDTVLLQMPLLNLEGIVSCSYKGASHRLMIACADRKITLSFMSESGKYLGTFLGETKGNVLLRKEQYRISDDLSRSLEYAKSFVFAKLYNARWVIERTTRDYPQRVDTGKLKNASTAIKKLGEESLNCGGLDQLRLVEGTAAQRYFEVFDDMILQNKETFYFKNRNRRPPTDPLNSLLSLTYAMLAHDCRGACEAVGLDSYCGFLHRDRPGRASLALDLMEEMRSAAADRFVLSLINLKVVNDNDFIRSGSGAVSLTESGRKKYFSAWQDRKREIITHPYLKEKLEWGLVPYSQALLLSRAIRGDIEAYPPFFWK